MAKSKKKTVVLTIAVVAILLASAVGVFIYVENNKTISLEDSYMDLSDAESLSICTVKTDSDSSFSQIVQSSTAVTINGNSSSSEMNYTYIVPPSKAKASLDGLQNKLFKDDGSGKLDKVQIYGNEGDMHSGKHSKNYSENIVYLEDCGNFILITYYKNSISDVYRHLNSHGDFWSSDIDYSSILVYKETGKVFPLTGLWCGCTYQKYVGTNDILPSITYVGKYQGEDLFKVNIENMIGKNSDNTGEFSEIRGLCTFKVVDGKLTYEKVITETNPKSYSEVDYMIGYVFNIYKNDVIYYYDRPGSICETTHNIHYLRFTDGSKKVIDKADLLECDGYACSSIIYENDLFPTSYTKYNSDGTTSDVNVNNADSYRIASEKNYHGMLYKEVYSDRTVVYYCDDEWKVYRLTIFTDLTYTQDSDIFGKSLFTTTELTDGIKIYDSKVFFGFETERVRETGPVLHSERNYYTGFVISEDRLFTMDDNKIAIYDLSDGSKKVVTVPEIESLLYIYVDGNGDFTVEGSIGENYAKAILDENDDTFKVIKSDIGISNMKTVKM